MFPESTYFGKRIAKQKFYDNLNVTAGLKRVFVEAISLITWRNKLSPKTINISSGNKVSEIEVLELELTHRNLNEKQIKDILTLMDREIPYHLLFLLKYVDINTQTKYQAWVGYKEESIKNTFKVSAYYHTDWHSLEDLPIKIDGLNLDAVYENFITQIGKNELSTNTHNIQNTQSIKNRVDNSIQKAKLEKQIEQLTTTIYKERQFNKQVAMNEQLKKLKIELEGLG